MVFFFFSQIAEKNREPKSKGEKKRYIQLNAEFQRIARRDKKAFLSEQCKVQFTSVMSDSLRTPWTGAHQASLSITNSRSLLKLRSIESVMPSNYLILSRPLLPPSIFPSMRVFSMSQFFTSGGQSIGVFSFSISPSN